MFVVLLRAGQGRLSVARSRGFVLLHLCLPQSSNRYVANRLSSSDGVLITRPEGASIVYQSQSFYNSLLLSLSPTRPPVTVHLGSSSPSLEFPFLFRSRRLSRWKTWLYENRYTRVDNLANLGSRSTPNLGCALLDLLAVQPN